MKKERGDFARFGQNHRAILFPDQAIYPRLTREEVLE